MAKTAAENQAAYRQRKAEKGSAESTEDGKATEVVAEKLSADSTEEVPTLSPGADCVPEEGTVESDRPGDTHDVSVEFTQEDGLGEPVAVCPDPPDTLGLPKDPVIEKLGKIIGMLKQLLLPKTEIPPPVQKEPAPESVGDLTQCMKCGVKLPPTETPRLVRELCHECVWRRTG